MKQAADETVIRFSKVKNLLVLVGSMFFLAFPLMDKNFLHQHIVISILTSVLAAFGVAVSIKLLLTKKPALILNQKGIYYNSIVSLLFIPWSDIIRITQLQYSYKANRMKFISIHVDNLEKYLNKGNLIKRILNRLNTNMCGTPINISVTLMKANYKKLFNVMKSYFKRYRITSNNTQTESQRKLNCV